MRKFEFRLSREEEEEFKRMIEGVKVNLRITGIRKKVSNSQVVKFILFERRRKRGLL